MAASLLSLPSVGNLLPQAAAPGKLFRSDRLVESQGLKIKSLCPGTRSRALRSSGVEGLGHGIGIGRSRRLAGKELRCSARTEAPVVVDAIAEDEGGIAVRKRRDVATNGAATSSSNGAAAGTNGATVNGAYLKSSSSTNGAANGAAASSYPSGNGAVNGAALRTGLSVGEANGAAASTSTSTSGASLNGASAGAGSKKGLTAEAEAVETVGQEEPWFKKSQRENIKVSVAPGGRWNRFKTYSTIQRSVEIWSFVFVFLVRSWALGRKWAYWGGAGMTEERVKGRRRALAKWLKEGLLRLGPTFIKLGQQFSTRVDILAQEYVDQLAELQDQVPPFESETAVAIVEEELGAPVLSVFERFDREPIAAASLGQVHRAQLDGRQVVVKVQRPGLKALFDIDLKNLRVIAQYLQKVDPKSDGAKRDWVAIYDECATVLYQEIDYTQEGQNADRFRANFANLPYVKVPEIVWEATTSRILTMEYVPGIKINRIDALNELGVDKQQLARYTVESYLEQILQHGFFHADPHPGNIAVDNRDGGRLIFYDFGMMGNISPNVREGLVEAFYGVYERNPDKVLEAMVQMGVLVPTGDMVAVRRTAQFFLSSFEERLEAQRKEREAAKAPLGFKKGLSKEEATSKKKQRLAAIGEDLLSLSVDQPFRFPATFTFVVRAFSVLDGIGKGLDPRFDISEIARPYALELLRFREVGYGLIWKDALTRWDRQARAFGDLFRGPTRVAKLEGIVTRLEQGELKLRVRTLESERAFKRVALMQANIGRAIAASMLVNLGTLLYVNAVRRPAVACLVASSVFALQLFLGLTKVKKMDEQEKLIMGSA